MINWLEVHNFVVVRQVGMTFDRGLTVVTGETGAGKSIIVDALALLLGDRASSDLIRPGCEQCEIQAGFDLAVNPATRQWLTEQELTGDESDCTLRRLIYRDKPSRGFINGRPVPIQSLREIGERLVDIHGQQDHHLLLKKENQRVILDAYADISAEVATLSGIHTQLAEAASALEKLRSRAAELREREDFLRHQVDELTRLAPDPDELAALSESHGRLAHTRELAEGAWQTLQELEEAEESAVATILAHAGVRLGGLATFDPRLHGAREQLEQIAVQLAETVTDLRRWQADYELDPAEFERQDRRLGALHDAARKYRVTPVELRDLLVRLQGDLAAIAGGDEQSAALATRIEQLEKDYDTLAERITQARQQAAPKLVTAVNGQLPALGLAGAIFHVALAPAAGGNRARHGAEVVQFRIRTAADMDEASLERAASGGELSRISLAVQLATAQTDHPVPSCVYDEVDVGIGGRVAEIVGSKLRELGGTRQVLCITHLPQVAVQGDAHLKVTRLAGTVTEVQVEALGAKERPGEIARMLGGVEITAKTRAHADDMLKRANS